MARRMFILKNGLRCPRAGSRSFGMTRHFRMALIGRGQCLQGSASSYGIVEIQQIEEQSHLLNILFLIRMSSYLERVIEGRCDNITGVLLRK